MSISGNYPTPVTVNGFLCRNCTDVDFAKKHIDPQHPRSGPYDIDAKTDPSQPAAVRFGGSLSGLNDAPPSSGGQNSSPGQDPSAAANSSAPPPTPGAQLDLVA